MIRRPVSDNVFNINDYVILNSYGIDCSVRNNKKFKCGERLKIIDQASFDSHNIIYEVCKDDVSEFWYDYHLQIANI